MFNDFWKFEYGLGEEDDSSNHQGQGRQQNEMCPVLFKWRQEIGDTPFFITFYVD